LTCEANNTSPLTNSFAPAPATFYTCLLVIGLQS
jgi:hypothetical protein